MLVSGVFWSCEYLNPDDVTMTLAQLHRRSRNRNLPEAFGVSLSMTPKRPCFGMRNPSGSVYKTVALKYDDNHPGGDDDILGGFCSHPKKKLHLRTWRTRPDVKFSQERTAFGDDGRRLGEVFTDTPYFFVCVY